MCISPPFLYPMQFTLMYIHGNLFDVQSQNPVSDAVETMLPQPAGRTMAHTSLCQTVDHVLLDTARR